MLALLEFGDQLARLRADRGLMASAVEEVLRWVTPVTHFARTVMRDTQIAGQPISAGERVVMWYTSANRDEEVFDQPEVFDISHNPNPHLTFGGGGPHYCIGNLLAVMELRQFLEGAVDLLPRLEITGTPVTGDQFHEQHQAPAHAFPLTMRRRAYAARWERGRMTAEGTTAGQRTALITGANRGIGRAVAAELYRRDLRVVVTARNADEASAAAAGIGAGVCSHPLDVTDPGSVGPAREGIGPVDVLVCSAACCWTRAPTRCPCRWNSSRNS